MTAFSQAQFDILTTTIEHAFHRHRQFSPCEVTRQDIIQGFVNPEDLEVQQRVSELYSGRLKYSPERMGIQLLTPYFEEPFPISIALQEAAYLPDYALTNIVFGSRPEHEKVSREINRYIELFRDYNLMVAVLTKLNEICVSPGQVVFLWPVVRDLTDMAKEQGHKVETLLKALDKRTTAAMPRVSLPLREACRTTGTTLTVLKMLGEPPLPTGRQVDVWAGGYANIRVVFDKSILAKLA